MPDIRELPEMSRLDISDPYRVYELLPAVHKGKYFCLMKISTKNGFNSFLEIWNFMCSWVQKANIEYFSGILEV